MGIVTFVTDKAVFVVYRNGNNNKLLSEYEEISYCDVAAFRIYVTVC